MSLDNLIANARYYALGDSTSSDFADTDVKRQLNLAYNQLTVLAFSVSGDWQFRGNNSQTTSITTGTRSYSLPTTFLRINRVEIKYPNSMTEYRRASIIDYKKIDNKGLDDYVSGVPQFDLKENSLEIFVSDKTADIEAVANGIIVYYDDEITELSSGSDEPDIPEPFSRLIALMAAKDYCGVNSMNNRLNWLNGEITKGEARFVEFIANRNEAKRTRMDFKKEDYGEGSETEYGVPSVDWS